MMTRRVIPIDASVAVPGRRYLTSREAQQYLGFATLHGFQCSYPRLGIPAYRLGKSLRFLQEDLDAAVSKPPVIVPEGERRRRRA